MKKKVNQKKETKKIIFLIVAIILVLSAIIALGVNYYKKATYEVKNPIATIEVEKYGTIKVELYPEYAPNTVDNFITLSNNGFYDGLKFHRIIKDFMIQGGDSKGDGTGSPTLSWIDSTIEKGSEEDIEYNIDGEFSVNKYEDNTLKLEKGVIAMARGDYSAYSSYFGSSVAEEGYNSAGSQFFIMTTDDNIALTGSYAGFGKVVEGFDVLEKVASVKVKVASEDDVEESTPVKDVISYSSKHLLDLVDYNNGQKIPLNVVSLNCFDERGCKVEVILGTLQIMEGMSKLIQELVYPTQRRTSPYNPYYIACDVAEMIISGIKSAPYTLIALLDFALQTTNPGLTYVGYLEAKLREGYNAQSLTPEIIYADLNNNKMNISSLGQLNFHEAYTAFQGGAEDVMKEYLGGVWYWKNIEIWYKNI